MSKRKKNIVVLGGGTGSFIILSGLKNYDLNLSAIVTMMDDGGSTGKLRDQLGVLPPGDLRQCLIALSQAPDIWRKLFTYRFETGDLAGHNFGNILISALEKVSSSYNDVVEEAHRIMDVSGRVIPVTHDKAFLRVEYESGRTLVGEKFLDEASSDGSKIKQMALEPQARLNPEVMSALNIADYIIAGPGDLYSSILSISLVKGFKEAFMKTNAKILFVMNLMTKSSQTPRYSSQDHIDDFVRYFGRSPDVILVNSEKIPKEVIKYYKNESDDIPVVGTVRAGSVISLPLISHEQDKANEPLAQKFAHSIIRHDIEKTALAIKEAVE